MQFDETDFSHLYTCKRYETMPRRIYLTLPVSRRRSQARRSCCDFAIAYLSISIARNFIAYEDTTVVPSLVKKASGIVLDLGPGPGNQVHRFDSSSVEYIYGIEPNAKHKRSLDVQLAEHGLTDKYRLITCGVEDSDVLRAEGISEESVDCVLCIQVLCAVDDPRTVMKEVYKLLKPGGKFIFWEHGCSRDRWTGVVQGMSFPAFCNHPHFTNTNISLLESRVVHARGMPSHAECVRRYSWQR